jgi:hypothetical protein
MPSVAPGSSKSAYLYRFREYANTAALYRAGAGWLQHVGWNRQAKDCEIAMVIPGRVFPEPEKARFCCAACVDKA